VSSGPQLLQIQTQDDSRQKRTTELEALVMLTRVRHHCFQWGILGHDLEFAAAFRTVNHLYKNLLSEISTRNGNKWPPRAKSRRIEKRSSRGKAKP
jgi:hypothetical protein